jgi:serine/threonine protein kinase
MGHGVQADRLEDGDLPAQFGRYTLVSVLGEGGMARVFRARLEGPEGFRKDVAVKVIHAALARNSDRLRRALINEGRLGGRLNHANVVNTYDYGETDGQPWVAMALVDGVTLDDVLRDVGPPPASVTVEIARQICAGLHHAHELKTDDGQPANLVHRDLKPANVMIGWDGVVKVMDFGIAKASQLSDGTTATGALKGTAAYMSPEQLRAQPLDRRSDVFALGVMLAEMATGRRLFRAESMPAIVLAIVSLDETLSGRLSPVREAVPGLAPILERCLAADADQRYSSSAAVGKDLRRLARELPSDPSLEDWLDGLRSGLPAVTGPLASPPILESAGTSPPMLVSPSPPASDPMPPCTPPFLPMPLSLRRPRWCRWIRRPPSPPPSLGAGLVSPSSSLSLARPAGGCSSRHPHPWPRVPHRPALIRRRRPGVRARPRTR